ncbi:glycosyltransferase [Solirhodobacter olei]|uniref:glycosyltransferase n=1 Tax=Solirhodobacter olei TaxID=2493082 RepID=UPI000FDC1644|nr:glycosyltransferase [Solirhodobacter olei]
MKILLLGEYSSLHKNLKEGLQELGHDAVVAGSGDGFKKVPVDIDFNSSLPGIFGKVGRRLKPILSSDQLKGYDIVQLINPFYLYYRFLPMSYFFDWLIRNNEKFFMLGAGDDAYFWKHGRRILPYGPFDDFLKYDLKSDRYYMDTEWAYRFNKSLLEKSCGIIPIMYEYEVGYRGESKRLDTIPIPINTRKVEYRENRVGNKLIVFHGLNRYGFKGTRHVEEAFDYLAKKYPNDLELVIDGKMPLDRYLELMRRTNVVIDQMYAHSLGLNGIYAMAMGKVVMGGAEPLSLKSLGVEKTPVINLLPSAKSVIVEIENLLDMRSSIKDLGLESRRFAELVHGHVRVAQKYVDTWLNN